MILRIGHLSTFYHTSTLLMRERGLEERLSALVEWRLFGTGPAIVNAFEKGELDLAYIGLPPAIIGISRGVPIVCVAGGHIEGTVIAGPRELVGYPEEVSLETILMQLKGKRIGVPGKGSIHDVILADCMDKYSLREEVTVENFPWSDLIIEAVAKGDVSAAFGTPALATALQRYAGGKILYPPAKLWPNNPSYGIIADRIFLERETGLVEKFLALHEEATSFMRNKPHDAAKAIADHVGIVDRDFVMDTLRISPKYCAQITEGYVSSTAEFTRALRRLGYISREVSSSEIFDASLIRRLHPSTDHYGDGLSEA